MPEYAAALALAQRLRDEREADPEAAPWSRADARRVVQTLQAVLELPAEDRATLAEADRLDAAREAACDFSGS